jgi:hypothetical protein
MSATTHSTPGAHDVIEEEFDRLASRLAEEADLEFEEICRRANQRLEEVFGYAVAQGVPMELRLEQLGERLG